MRDIIITALVLGSIPYMLRKPSVGIIMWVWISVMNPHRLAWGFAYDLPFAEIIAISTMLGLLFTKDEKYLPVRPVTICLFLYMIWMNITSLFAIHPDQVYFHWITIMKTLLMIFIAMTVMHSKQHIRWLVWMLVISLGFFGTKGGIFTVLHGGSFTVWGPPGSYIEENNALALALVMTIPLMRYLQLTETDSRIRKGLGVAMLLCGFSALGSYSRGALIAVAFSSLFLWLKSPRKGSFGIIMIIVLPLLITFMPAKWTNRMHTIDTYQEDASAMGRINAWWMAWHLALDRPLVGGGFEIYDKGVFALYAPNPRDVHAAHSIYFQALGEHGFVGLGLFLSLGFLTWRNGSWIIARTKRNPDYLWATNLARMIQVSQVAFATGGTFLSLDYFDLPYYELAIMLLTRVLVEKELSGGPSTPNPIQLQRTASLAQRMRRRMPVAIQKSIVLPLPRFLQFQAQAGQRET
ncbi:MAG: putative O-glycosylation ligase, exosortase A system-associated [Burkholderiales bacterium]|nr:putative O-glycosylation ligase, exosortase A system-associated [Burkholderiales bacterium]